MKVVYLTKPGKMEIVEEKRPMAGPGNVLVKVEYNGICGSDVHFFKDGRVGDCVLRIDSCWGMKFPVQWQRSEKASPI